MRNLILFLVGLGVVIGCGSQTDKKEVPAATSTQTDAAITADTSVVFRLSAVQQQSERELGVIDLGRMTSGEVVVGKMYLENGFDKPLVLLSMTASCGCLSFEYNKSPLKPGEKRRIEYRYDSKTKSGKQYSSVSIKTAEGGYGFKAECDVK